MSEEKKEQLPSNATATAKESANKSSIIAEFKEFISRGNVMDLAVGIIIGAAFTDIVNSLVNNIIMPFVGMFIGGLNFHKLKIEIPWGDRPVILYGSFLQAVVNFLIIAACVFFIVKAVNKVIRKRPAPPKKPSNEEILLTEIRDLLKKQQENK